ncbi:MAG: DUF4407 domain-containing protein [Betaproteobacteria bacterium]|nr:DUF4407 domain-containing protein [Betaproteobacteria bacterium]
MFLTFPLSFLGAALYAQANLVPQTWSALESWVVAIGFGLGWGLCISMILDRLMLIASDAISVNWALHALAILRIALVLGSSWVVSDEIVLWVYRAPISDTQRQMALDVRSASLRQIGDLHGLSASLQDAEKWGRETARLETAAQSLPAEIREGLNAGEACLNAVAKARGLLLRNAPEEISAVHLARLKQLDIRQQQCKDKWRMAVARRDAWRQEMRERLQEARARQVESDGRLRMTQEAVARENAPQSEAITRNQMDGSNRELAFERLKTQRPEVNRKAMVIWLVLMLLEVTPLMIKWWSSNNPVFQSIRAQLATEASSARMQTAYAEAHEAYFKDALAGMDMREVFQQESLNLQKARGPLSTFDAFCANLDVSAQKAKTFAQRHPGHAGLVMDAFSGVVEKALGKVSS